MIKNYEKFKKFENDFISKEKLSIEQSFCIMDEMYKEAAYFGIFPLKSPLEDIEDDIRLAKILNGVSKDIRKTS